MNQITDRTPQLIAAEINSIKEQTRKMLLFNSIEIGRRLVEAKSMLEHGGWSSWLKDSVDYSQRTATNLMRIFEEYGANQISFFGDNAKRQTFANLSYSQAIALLGVPEEEREQFIKENDVENMSTRELQQAIKEKQELEEKLRKAEQRAETERQAWERVSDSYKRLEETNKKHYEKSETLRKELKETKRQLAEAKASGNSELVDQLQDSLKITEQGLKESSDKIKELERQLKEKPIEVSAATVIEKIPEDIEKELNELRQKAAQQSNAAALRFKVYFDELVSNFKNLLGSLDEIQKSDTEAHGRYKNAVIGLIGKMSERL